MKSQIAYILISLTFLSVIISCSDDNILDENQELNIKVQKDVDYIFRSAEIIKNKNIGNRDPLPSFSTQAELDFYLVEVGEAPGSVSLSFFNLVLANIGMAESEGMEFLLNQYYYPGFMKSTLLANSTGEVIENLPQLQEYIDLNISDKETILLSNLLIDNMPTESSNPACFIAVIGGASIGAAICGPPCGIAGGIVGLVVCSWVKAHQQ